MRRIFKGHDLAFWMVLTGFAGLLVGIFAAEIF